MKICYHCKESKELIDFGKMSSSKDGLNPTCKKCRILINKKSIEKVGRKELTKEQKERIKKYKARWFQENKERLYKKQVERYKNNPKAKLNHLMSGGILKCLGRDKNGNKWTDIVGYKAENLSKGDKIYKNLILEYNIIDLLPKEVVFENL